MKTVYLQNGKFTTRFQNSSAKLRRAFFVEFAGLGYNVIKPSKES
ncbi:MAG: hypothetical protein GQF41_2942 [Candidatus Rifleibacterium amylolyticum]|nr:MAG: hypothetical protein GQF41_2942 [Candidatus Rifleibacterium amylolyticum]